MRKMENTRFVNKGIVKKDAKALLSGRPVYTDDIAPSDCLVVKLLRSPHAHAWIEDQLQLIMKEYPNVYIRNLY